MILAIILVSAFVFALGSGLVTYKIIKAKKEKAKKAFFKKMGYDEIGYA